MLRDKGIHLIEGECFDSLELFVAVSEGLVGIVFIKCPSEAL
jgi:hypothetical protein